MKKPKDSEPIDSPIIIQNARKCLMCDKIIASIHTHDYQTCGCENDTMVDGGPDYCRCGAVDFDKTVNLCLDDSMSIHYINENLLWGTYGKDGKQPLEWKFICMLETDHLIAILDNVKKIGKFHRGAIIATLKKRKIDISKYE